jgi:hypothetical protein
LKDEFSVEWMHDFTLILGLGLKLDGHLLADKEAASRRRPRRPIISGGFASGLTHRALSVAKALSFGVCKKLHLLCAHFLRNAKYAKIAIAGTEIRSCQLRPKVFLEPLNAKSPGSQFR